MRERAEFLAVCVLAAVALIAAWAVLPQDAFWTGDSGVKLLQVENLLASRYGSIALQYNGSDIDPSSQISPFTIRPSVYIRDGRNYSLFPVLFPFLSSLFYAVLGYAGLYVLPMGSGLLCLPLAYAIARRFTSHRWALAAMAAVVLATPMAFYSLTFWEHTPAVCLVLAAVWLLLRCGERAGQAAAAGLLLGAAVWLRTEMLVLTALLYFTAWRYLRRPRAVKVSMVAAAVPLAALVVFNRVVYGEWVGHIARNLAAIPGQADGGWMDKLNLRAGWLWTSLLGINAPQPLTAEQVGWERSFDVIRGSGPLGMLAFCAVGGIVACSAVGSSIGGDGGKGRGVPRWALGVQMALLAVLALAVYRYVLTFPQDRSPLITVLKSGGVFTFSPFLAGVLIWPLLPTSDSPRDREFKWLLYAAGAFLVVMPVLAPNDGGIRYGARYLLPAIALLAILAVAVFEHLCRGWGRWGFGLVLAAGLVLSVAIQVRGVQLLYHKKIFSRDFTQALMDSPARRTAVTYWWIPFEAPRVMAERKVHAMSLNPRAMDWLITHARAAGDTSVNIVVLGKKDVFPPVPGAVVVGRAEVVHPFDTYFNLTIFTLAIEPR